MAARVHQLLTLVDQREVEIGDDLAFARTKWLAEQTAIGRCNRREAISVSLLPSARGFSDAEVFGNRGAGELLTQET